MLTSDQIRTKDEWIVREGVDEGNTDWDNDSVSLKGPLHMAYLPVSLSTHVVIYVTICIYIQLNSVSNSNPFAYLNSQSNSKNPGPDHLPSID